MYAFGSPLRVQTSRATLKHRLENRAEGQRGAQGTHAALFTAHKGIRGHWVTEMDLKVQNRYDASFPGETPLVWRSNSTENTDRARRGLEWEAGDWQVGPTHGIGQPTTWLADDSDECSSVNATSQHAALHPGSKARAVEPGPRSPAQLQPRTPQWPTGQGSSEEAQGEQHEQLPGSTVLRGAPPSSQPHPSMAARRAESARPSASTARAPRLARDRRSRSTGRDRDSTGRAEVMLISAVGAAAGLTAYGAIYSISSTAGAAAASTTGLGIDVASGLLGGALSLVGASTAGAAVSASGRALSGVARSSLKSSSDTAAHLTATAVGCGTAMAVTYGGHMLVKGAHVAGKAASAVGKAGAGAASAAGRLVRDARYADQDGIGDVRAWRGVDPEDLRHLREVDLDEDGGWDGAAGPWTTMPSAPPPDVDYQSQGPQLPFQGAYPQLLPGRELMTWDACTVGGSMVRAETVRIPPLPVAVPQVQQTAQPHSQPSRWVVVPLPPRHKAVTRANRRRQATKVHTRSGTGCDPAIPEEDEDHHFSAAPQYTAGQAHSFRERVHPGSQQLGYGQGSPVLGSVVQAAQYSQHSHVTGQARGSPQMGPMREPGTGMGPGTAAAASGASVATDGRSVRSVRTTGRAAVRAAAGASGQLATDDLGRSMML